ncbi:uncharacterized protein LOC116208073 isoform X2 [Punica granatum]|nr:uncharacterized protein LOC116208073 isoform X2 [Punica granatum]XP_031397170.1 uncharacterized protein LOC116208073 isoform X2 [Punica granatum]
MRLCGTDKVVEVFERGVLAVTYSVGLWVNYCQFASSVFEDPDDVRRLFKRAISFVGKDYSCHSLWDLHIEFEFSQQHWSSLAHIFIQTLRFPTKRLHHYYESFQKLVTIWEEEMETQKISAVGPKPEADLDNVAQASYGDEEICDVISKLLHSSDGHTMSRELQKYKAIGERLYKNSCLLDEKIVCFESNIHRSYFHVKPLDTSQLENWHKYLDFVEAQKDFDWVVKLYERCLIPAANYCEFWMRYVAYMESKGGREIANFALDRATEIFLKDIPIIHVYNSRFKEASGDIMGARAAMLRHKTESDENFVDNAIIKASMEKRLGNLTAASNIYCEAIDRAISKEELNLLPTLYVHYSQHLSVTTNSAVAARDILINGIKHMPSCKFLYEELIKFATTHGGQEHIDVVGSIVAAALSTIPGESQVLDSTDQKDISNLYLKFVDHCGTIYDIRKAWSRHVKIFPCLLRVPYESPPTGIKSWKSLLEGKHKTYADKPSESISIQPEETSLPEHAAFRPKLGSVGNASSERRHQASNMSSEQSMENEAESVQVPQKCMEGDNTGSNHDCLVNQSHLPVALKTPFLDPPKGGPSRSVSDGSHEGEDPEEISVSNRVVSSENIAEIHASDQAEGQRTVSPPPYSSSQQNQNHSSFESRSRWHRMNHSDRSRQDSRFGFRGQLRRRPHHHQQLYPPQPESPLTETGHTSFPPQNQQIHLGNNNGNQLQAWPTLNYNFAPGYRGQVFAQNVTYPQVQFPNYPALQGSEQSGAELESNQAHYNQMWQYYYYYQQQQLFIQQQMQQLELTQAQLQQQQQSPEYQHVLQQLNQLQHQQQQLYQLQQQLYQQLQTQQQLVPQQQSHQGMQVSQQDQLFYMPLQQQLSQQQESFLQQQFSQSDQLQVQQNQESNLQLQRQRVEEEGLKEEEEAKKVHQPQSTP